MPMALVLLLLLFWLFLSWRAFQRGDMAMAVLWLVVGIALTAYRLKTVKKPAQ